MKIDPTIYDGRGPALVKHTFILKYLPTLIAKIASTYDEFIYVDLFAGPWKERTEDLSDTAFAIAIESMRDLQSVWKSLGRSVKMTAHLVDSNSEAIAKQRRLIDRYPEIVVHQHHDKAEVALPEILRLIPEAAFCFAFIDPKGVPDIRKFQALISRQHTEVFLNFMFQFANRFAATEQMRTLEWLTVEDERDAFRKKISKLSGKEREDALTDKARSALAKMGEYRFAPAITVDEEDVDRCLYKLIYLSRHPKGIQVFRDAQRETLKTQAKNRTGRKSYRRAEKTGTADLFEEIEPVDQAERSATEIRDGIRDGDRFARSLIEAAGENGIHWRELWPRVLEETVTTHKDLGDAITEMRNNGEIVVPDWGERVRKPRDEYKLFLSEQ